METNKNRIVKHGKEALVIRQTFYVTIVQMWVTTNDHCFVKIAAVF